MASLNSLSNSQSLHWDLKGKTVLLIVAVDDGIKAAFKSENWLFFLKANTLKSTLHLQLIEVVCLSSGFLRFIDIFINVKCVLSKRKLFFCAYSFPHIFVCLLLNVIFWLDPPLNHFYSLPKNIKMILTFTVHRIFIKQQSWVINPADLHILVDQHW